MYLKTDNLVGEIRFKLQIRAHKVIQTGTVNCLGGIHTRVAFKVLADVITIYPCDAAIKTPNDLLFGP